MPIVSIPEESFSYNLIAFGKDGRERVDDPDGLMSERLQNAIAETGITDVFIVSHGWKGDLPAAREQYNRWIGAMLACKADREQLHEKRRSFSPLVVGFHWPSLPFGDEELGRMGPAFAATQPPSKSIEDLIDIYAARLSQTPAAREALRVIITAAQTAPRANELPEDVRNAYVQLDREAALGAEGPAAAPGDDREPFDPDRAYRARGAMVQRSFGGSSSGDALLAPLRQLSFWAMKNRGRRIGEAAGSRLLRGLQDAGAASGVRFHLIGHSFGCIVVSAMLKGSAGTAGAPLPVDSMTLIQGALSIWSFCTEVPDAGGAGYFREIVAENKVRGPLLMTQSRYDTAVGKLYPIAAGAAGQVTFAPGQWPKYGALGAFGARGRHIACQDQPLRALDEAYDFHPQTMHNLEASSYICEGSGFSGAHNDIARPEVAHAVWQAALCGL
jgi:hypothetical protein